MINGEWQVKVVQIPALKALATVIPTGTGKLLANQTAMHHMLASLSSKKKKESKKERKSLSIQSVSDKRACWGSLEEGKAMAKAVTHSQMSRATGTREAAGWVSWCNRPCGHSNHPGPAWHCWRACLTAQAGPEGFEEPARSPMRIFEAALPHCQ